MYRSPGYELFFLGKRIYRLSGDPILATQHEHFTTGNVQILRNSYDTVLVHLRPWQSFDGCFVAETVLGN